MSDASQSRAEEAVEASPRFAYATLVTTDSYVDGALVLLHSLRRTLTPYSIVCLATPSSLGEHSLQRLRAHFDGVIEAELRLSADDDNLDLLGRPDLRSTLTKIQLWDPALFGAWDAICYLDADTLVRQPIDDMFLRFDSWRHECSDSWKQGGLIAAAPDTGWPDCFNSGVLLLAPGYECYRDLVNRAATSTASFDGADQGLLNEHFSDWSTASPYRRLPFLYNATANVYYTYKPALQRFGYDVRVVHFIGISKPWHWERFSGGLLHSDPTTSERWRQLVNLWWNIHDEYVSGWRHWKGPYDKELAFGKGYHHITEPPASLLVHTEQNSSVHCDALDSGGDVYNQPPNEVPDWEKDWSWATDRVHPLDYSYLTTHANTTQQQQQPGHGHGYEELRQPHTPQCYESPRYDHHHHHVHHDNNGESHHHDHGYCEQHHKGDEQAPDPASEYQHHQHHREAEHQHHSSAQAGNTEHQVRHHHCHDQHATHHHHQEQPAWMQSQRPWEDVAREGWMHHDEYKPHTYDQAYVDRHVDQPRHDDYHYHHHHHHRYDGEHRWHGADGGSEYVSMPLSNNQALYEATQVVLQPRDSGNAYYHCHDPQQYWQHDDQHSHGHGGGYDSQQYYASHHEHRQIPDMRSSRSTSGSSPLHYPQPKSPMIVNPVALWESSEEQARRRAWAEHVRRPLANTQNPTLDGAPWPIAAPSADQRVPSSAMDQIDSSQLPRETPWKISHVRQRPSSIDENSPTVPPQATHMGMQFKEGVANDGNARDAAGRLLQRWNEAVIARNLRSQFGNIDPEQIMHSIAKVERGTDAIRLETTVSCEAEDSKGERTVYRFTLSSTLDVGGAAPQGFASTPLKSQQQDNVPAPGIRLMNPPSARARSSAAAPAAASMEPALRSAYNQALPEDLYNDGSADIDNQPGSADITLLRQPPNYQEPAMSRRSSFVQLQPSQPHGTRLPATAMRVAPNCSDQFAESDARYWRLQRQLIDLEMNQRRQDADAQPAASGLPYTPGRNISGWDDQDTQKLDLASPPTPTHNVKPLAEFDDRPVRKLVRKPSAFSVADPEALVPPGGQVPSGVGRDLGARKPEPKNSTDVGPASEPTGPFARQRSASSPRLPDESTLQYGPTAPLGLSTGAPHVQSPLAVTDGASSRKPAAATAGVVSPNLSKRSRSYTALHRIATHNSAQAAVAPLAAAAGAKATMHAAFDSSSPVSLESDNAYAGADNDSDADSQAFKPALGRSPTPFPRMLLAKSKEAVGIASSTGSGSFSAERGLATPSGLPIESGKRSALGLLSIEPRGSGFEPSTFDMSSPGSAGTPVTPGRQKLRPKINWGDDEDNGIPPENDQSIDAQWLRIVNGAPPPRAPVLPAGAIRNASKPKTGEPQAVVDKPRLPSAPVQDVAEEPVDTTDDEMMSLGSLDASVDEDDGASRDLGANLEAVADDVNKPNSLSAAIPESETVPAESQPAPPQTHPAPGTRAPPRKLHSTRSFLNLTSQEYDTLSDSEVDASEAELQARFWARAMKPAKSGNASPYSPGRRKSVVEMSSGISPRDLEEWMQWQGDNSTLDRRTSGKPTNTQANIGEQVSIITPPASKNAGGSSEPLDEALAAGNENVDGDSSDDDALQMRRPKDEGTRNTMDRPSDEDMEVLGLSYEEDADAESECGGCFDSIEYAEIVETGVTSLAAGWGSRSSMLLSGSDDQTCRLWDTRTSKAACCIRGFSDEITAVEFAGNHSIVAASGSSIYIYDQRALGVVSQASEATSLFANKEQDEVQALSTRGDFIAYVDDSGRLGVCDITDDPLSAAPVLFVGGHEALAGCVCIHPEQPVIASGGFDRQVILWDMASETKTRSFIAESSDACDDTNKSFNPPFAYALAFAPGAEDCLQLVSGHADGSLMCLSDETVFRWASCHGYSISAVRFVSAQPEILATASLDCTLALWDAESILSPDVEALSSTTTMVGDKPRQLALVELSAKPDTLASSETTPVIYTDQGCDIIAYTIP
ncbi:glycogenin glucosyltransferase [Coemansia sp. RSA 2050]|nr:glycogenin glucosyltransferase [Coemansia sp. RSA 2050]